jgi:hypothetical protein
MSRLAAAQPPRWRGEGEYEEEEEEEEEERAWLPIARRVIQINYLHNSPRA